MRGYVADGTPPSPQSWGRGRRSCLTLSTHHTQHTRPSMSLSLLLLLLLLLPHPGSSTGVNRREVSAFADVWVDPRIGDDENNGEGRSPFRTINRAMEMPGNLIVNLFDGRYVASVGNGGLALSSRHLTIVSFSKQKHQVVIDMEDQEDLFMSTVNATMEIGYFTMVNCGEAGCLYAVDSLLVVDNVDFSNNAMCVSSAGGELQVSGSRFMANTRSIVTSYTKSALVNVEFLYNSFRAVAMYSGAIKMTGCSFLFNTGWTSNSFAFEAMSIDMTDVLVANNSNTIFGPSSIVSSFGTSITNCVFQYNEAAASAALLMSGVSGVSVVGCSFIGNTATSNGILNVVGASNVTISDCVFSNNVAGTDAGDGAAIGMQGQNITVTQCLFNGNKGSAPISATHTRNGVVSESHFLNNVAPSVSCISAELGGDLLITENEFRFNMASDYGCVASTGDFEMTIELCWFDNNVGGSGGVLALLGEGSTTINRNIFTSNTAVFGGAVYSETSEHTGIETNTFTGNHADVGGAAYFSSLMGDLVKCRLCSQNTASRYGDVFATPPTKLQLDKAPKDTFANLEVISVEVQMADAFGSVVRGEGSNPVVFVSLTTGGRKGALLNARPQQVDVEGVAKFEFAIVGEMGEDYVVNFTAQSLNETSFTSSPEFCKSDEVGIGFPPDSGNFEVCVEASTEDGGVTLDVLHWVIGLLVCALAIADAFLCGLVFATNNMMYQKEMPFQFDPLVAALNFAGVLLGCIGCLLLIPDLTDAICVILPWVWGFVYLLMAVPIVTQLTYTSWSGRLQTPWMLQFICYTGVAIPVLIVLVTWTAAFTLEQEYIEDDNDLTPTCDGDHAMVFASLLIGVLGVVLVTGVLVALGANIRFRWKGRHSQLTESWSLVIVNMLMITAVIFAVVMIKHDDLVVRFMTFTCGFILAACLTLIVVYILPLSQIFRGEFFVMVDDNFFANDRDSTLMTHHPSETVMMATGDIWGARAQQGRTAAAGSVWTDRGMISTMDESHSGGGPAVAVAAGVMGAAAARGGVMVDDGMDDTESGDIRSEDASVSELRKSAKRWNDKYFDEIDDDDLGTGDVGFGAVGAGGAIWGGGGHLGSVSGRGMGDDDDDDDIEVDSSGSSGSNGSSGPMDGGDDSGSNDSVRRDSGNGDVWSPSTRERNGSVSFE